ncbi:MAG: NAD(P)H-dependent oxidoreductase subunit E [Bacteroidales bacterium]|nr:NAD(P)H-dependent oxidoreductase subunit E [Bacteroidales bacterium]MDD4603898.1 NAD(P)H-dependent oxidoreductase subunit E [Bacteroidales bacterium]
MNELIEKMVPRFPVNKKDSLLGMLQEIQKAHGFLTEELIREVAQYLHLPVNKIYGLATFYDQFRFHALGKYHFQICNGTSCHLSESSINIKDLENQLYTKDGGISRDRKFSLESVSCMGSCEQGPVVKINATVFTNVSPDELNRIIRSLKDKTE